MTLLTIFPFLLSCLSIYHAHLIGELHPKAWIFGLCCQSFWFIWIAWSGNWGFIVLTAVLSHKYYINHKKWKAAGII